MLFILTFSSRSVKKGRFITRLYHSPTSGALDGLQVVNVYRMKGFKQPCGRETVVSNSQGFLTLETELFTDALHGLQAQLRKVGKRYPYFLTKPDLISIHPPGEILLLHALQDGLGLYTCQSLVRID